jgi:hypothetical protein
MYRSYFYEANKTGLAYFYFFYDFWRILQDLCFCIKRENEKKRKNTCMGLILPTKKSVQLQGFSPG